jgi:DNA polymerase I-like protein with 3'-5' exonuclease and polymerase domains
MDGWDWAEAIELEHKFAAIMQRQEENGVYFDMGAATALESVLVKEIEEIENDYDLPGKYRQVGATVTRPFKINGDPTKRTRDWYRESYERGSPEVRGPFTKVEHLRLNLGSDKQVKEYLLEQGWKPTQWNYIDGERSSPKLTEDSFGTISGEFGQKIKRRKICSHRLSQIRGWINNVRPDGRITAAANTIGTPTGRCRHRIVVNVPAKRAAFGVEMRSLFTVPEGYVMVGHDADQIELRMLAHYMGDEDYIQAILDGDIHTYNQSMAGLDTRDAAKSFIYAFIYGAGNEKLGQLAGGGSGRGRSLRSKFLRELPALKRLIDTAKFSAERGWLKGLDGRKIWMRRDGESGRVLAHKALNTLLQCGDAVVMKRSAIILDEMIKLNQIEAIKVIDMHDEAQAEVALAYAERYARLAERSLTLAGEYYKLNIPIAGKASIGKNWYETH